MHLEAQKRKRSSLHHLIVVKLLLNSFFPTCHHLWCESFIAVVFLHYCWQSEITCQSVWVLLLCEVPLPRCSLLTKFNFHLPALLLCKSSVYFEQKGEMKPVTAQTQKSIHQGIKGWIILYNVVFKYYKLQHI